MHTPLLFVSVIGCLCLLFFIQVVQSAGVGSYVMHEDDDIKVWDMVLFPGETAPLHTHTMGYTFVILNGSTMEVTGEKGEHLTTFTIDAGESLSFDLVGDELVDTTGKYRISKTHAATNVGKTLFREILIEKKAATFPTSPRDSL